MGAAMLKISSLDEREDMCFSTAIGVCFIMVGGWLDLVSMYKGMSLGFLYGWYVPVLRLRVTSTCR